MKLDTCAVWTRLDGGLSITYFGTNDKLLGETDQELIQGMLVKQGAAAHLQGATVTLINKADVPAKTQDRDCWSLNGNKVEVDAQKLSAKQAKASEKESKKQAILSKLKIDESDLQVIKELVK